MEIVSLWAAVKLCVGVMRLGWQWLVLHSWILFSFDSSLKRIYPVRSETHFLWNSCIRSSHSFREMIKYKKFFFCTQCTLPVVFLTKRLIDSNKECWPWERILNEVTSGNKNTFVPQNYNPEKNISEIVLTSNVYQLVRNWYWGYELQNFSMKRPPFISHL